MSSGPKIIPSRAGEPITQEILDHMNVAQQAESNRHVLDELGGPEGLASRLNVDVMHGLTTAQYEDHCSRFGLNRFPEKPMTSFFALFFDALNDFTIIILICSALVSLFLGIFLEGNPNGWIEGTAILIAVLLVSSVTATNDYNKELQFRALEKSSQADEHCTVVRNGSKALVNPSELSVGDIVVLQAGDGIPADGVVVDNAIVMSNESALTGEPEPLKKRKDGDPFLLSSCTLTDGEEVRMMVIGIGASSQWGRIRATLIEESAETPLQTKLAEMAKTIGYMGTISATLTFIVLLCYILFVDHKQIASEIVHAFIIAITVIVVSIPEGLPLAVTISLAYSTRKMYDDQNLIRVLAACETMGNATNICSDKTGTLTENRMTVVEGWFAGRVVDQEQFKDNNQLTQEIKSLIAEHVCINRLAYLVFKDSSGKPYHRPEIVGNATEGALIIMARNWGFDYEAVSGQLFNQGRDKIFPFNSKKKRSTTVLHRPDGTVRVYCKGAPEWILNDCTHYTKPDGSIGAMTPAVRQSLDDQIVMMADRALRTLCIAHRDFARAGELPRDWHEAPPDTMALVCDAIVGIIDPLRGDVKEAVRIAQSAGVTVRMVTGDNINTARAIAKQCGILTPEGLSMEGPVFRNLSPKEVDAILPRLQVLARSSPEDKFLLVTRLNGHGIPSTREEWEEKHPGASWERDRDRLLPGYREEWEASRPEGGQVVGVTGDGTNDAPALKAADVGLAMGITGTRVAKDASDIVILDDKFSSIVRAIMWGRSVFDNIRKFLQFQLTVNIVACTLVFIAAVAGRHPPLNAVMMLWVNLIMDTLGALALGTEEPTLALLERKPYKRSAFILSRPIIRHILIQAVFQLILLNCLFFVGAPLFDVEMNSVKHNTIVFNTFVFCQVFNEINARSLGDKWNILEGISTSPMLLIIHFSTIFLQALIVQFGGAFTQTTPLTWDEWLITVGFAALTFPVGVLMRLPPVEEDPNSFFDNSKEFQRAVDNGEGVGDSGDRQMQMITNGKKVDMV